MLGSLLFTQKHLVGYLKVSLTQKKLRALLGCYIFLSPLFPPGPSWQEHHAQLDALIASLHVGDAVGGDAVCRGGGSERLSCFFLGDQGQQETTILSNLE